MAHFHDIAGGRVVGVVGKEHQDIKGRLRQLQLLTQGLADRIVGLRDTWAKMQKKEEKK